MKNTLILFLSLILFGQSPLFAQKNYKVLLQAGTFVPVENGASFSENPVFDPNEIVQGRVYRVVQFYDLPSVAEHASLKAADIQLLSYLPHYAYITSLPATVTKETLQRFDIRGVFSIPNANKSTPTLQVTPHTQNFSEVAELVISVQEDLRVAGIEQALVNLGCIMIFSSENNHVCEAMVPVEQIQDIIALPFVSYVEEKAVEEEDLFESRGLIKSSYLASGINGMKVYEGEGVNVAINDLNYMFPDHLDFRGRTNMGVNNTSISANQISQHGSHVSGIVGGAGNLNPLYKGMAPKVSFFNFRGRSNPVFNNAAGAVAQGITLTQTSTGSVCNSSFPTTFGYSSNARSADIDMSNFPKYLHVFSAGNNGNSDVTACGGLGTGWRSISGGSKMGKNVITVGNLTPQETLSNSSSRGPAMDNRIKPDICAMGTGVRSTNSSQNYVTLSGTSMSAPAISGLLAQLTEAYKDLYGENPDGGLLKAILLNTADDLGNPGPDYSFGWGKANARKFLEVLQKEQFQDSTLAVNQTHTISLNIPAGIDKARIMLYWTDEAGTTFSSVNLVNNLDLKVTDVNQNDYLPWKLDPGSNVNTTTIQLPATKGVDNLNNMEQVEIDAPAEGVYQVEVKGTAIPFGTQKYYLVYEFIKDEIVVTFPVGNESLAPLEDVIIRWDALADTGNFDIDYTIDNGANWLSVVQGLPGSQRYLYWQTPDDITGQARIRVSRGAQADESDANFTIIKAPSNIQFARVCQDFLTMTWDAVQGATSYDVFVLGEKFMDSVGNTNSTFFEPQIRYQDVNWVSIRARGDSGILGRRAIAVPTNPGTLINCAALPPVAGIGIDTVLCTNERISIQDLSTKSPDLWGWSINPPLVAFADGTSPTSQNPVVVFNQPDTFTITLSVNNVAGSNSVTKQVVVLPPPTADFATTTTGAQVEFNNLSANASGYRWYFGDGDSSDLASPMHTYAAPGDYTATLTVFSPCGDITTTKDVQAWATSISDAFLGLEVALTPNPSNGKFNLNLSGELASTYNMQLLSLQGKTIFEETIRTQGSSFSKSFDFSAQAAGLYFLRLSDGARVGTVKVVIE